MFYRTPFLIATLAAFAMSGCDRPADTLPPADSTVVETESFEVITPLDATTTPEVATTPEVTATPGVTATPEVTMTPEATTTPGVATEVEVANKAAAETKTAQCELVEIGDSGVKGTIKLVQTGDNVKITGKVTGLTPGLHGFHVHEKGDLSDTETGASAGGHFNPTDQPHGKTSDEKRHVGDLGNIEANADGVATIDMQDKVISLSGDHSVVGKALLIHAGEDKFTQPVGDAGGRVAFGKIELQ